MNGEPLLVAVEPAVEKVAGMSEFDSVQKIAQLKEIIRELPDEIKAQAWLDDACYARYLRARRGDIT